MSAVAGITPVDPQPDETPSTADPVEVDRPRRSGVLRSIPYPELERIRPGRLDPQTPVLGVLRENVTACALRLGRACRLPLRLEWVDAWRAPAESAVGTAAWWWPRRTGSLPAALGMTAEAAAYLADVFLGGDGSNVPDADTVGELEIAVLTRHLQTCFRPLEALVADGPGPAGLVTAAGVSEGQASPALPSSLAGTDALLLRLALRDEQDRHPGDILVMLPAVALLDTPRAKDKARDRRGAGVDAADALGGVPVTVRLRLAAVQLAALDVHGLEAGDIVRLQAGTRVEGFLDSGRAAGMSGRVLSGSLGRRGDRFAVQITSVPLESS